MLNQLARAIKHTPRLFLRANVSTYVVAVEVVDGGLAEHGVVLELTLAERRGVASNDDELGLAGTDSLDRGLVSVVTGQRRSSGAVLTRLDVVASLGVENSPEGNLTGLHNKRKARVDGVGGLCLLGGHLCVGFWGLSGCWKKYGAPVLLFYRLLEREESKFEMEFAKTPAKLGSCAKRKATRPDGDGVRRSPPSPSNVLNVVGMPWPCIIQHMSIVGRLLQGRVLRHPMGAHVGVVESVWMLQHVADIHKRGKAVTVDESNKHGSGNSTTTLFNLITLSSQILLLAFLLCLACPAVQTHTYSPSTHITSTYPEYLYL